MHKFFYNHHEGTKIRSQSESSEDDIENFATRKVSLDIPIRERYYLISNIDLIVLFNSFETNIFLEFLLVNEF